MELPHCVSNNPRLMAKKITIYDIADRLKLSPSTVSRALADNPLINIKTKTRVRMAAEEMGYHSGTKSTSGTKAIVAIVPEIDNSFYSSVLATIQENLGNDYLLVVMCSYNSASREQELVARLDPSQVRCLIISQSMDTESSQHLKEAQKRGLPTILFNRTYYSGGCPKFLIDDYMDSYMLTKHLVSTGKKRIAFAAKHFKCPIYKERIKAYKDVLKQSGLSFNSDHLIYSELTLEDTHEVISRFIRMNPRPDALILPNFVSALQATSIAKINNISIPHDLAIVSFDDDPECRYSSPSITGIERPTTEIGEEIAGLLKEICNGNLPEENLIRIFKSDLIIRGSSFTY